MSRQSMERRIQFLEGQLRDVQMAEAARRTAANDVAEKIIADKTADERAGAKLAEAQTMRRNAWVNHLIVNDPPTIGGNRPGAGDRLLDIAAIEAAIPADQTLYPPGFDESLVVYGTTKTPTPTTVEMTTLGKLAKGVTL
jgi:hypothetical protein